VEKSDFDQIRSVVENWTRQNPFDFNGKELILKFSELCDKCEKLDKTTIFESQRLDGLIQELDAKVQVEFEKSKDARVLVNRFQELQEAFKKIEESKAGNSRQVEFLDENVKKIQLQVFDVQQRIQQLEVEFGQKAMSEIVQQFTEFKQHFRKNFAEQSLDFVKIDDLKKLDQKIDFLRKMFDSEFSENTILKTHNHELEALKERVSFLQKSLQEELLNGEDVDEIASNIEVLQNTVIELQKRFSAQINEKLDAKANAYEIANLEHQIGELTLIVEQISRSESPAGIGEILEKFNTMEEKFNLDQQAILEKINYLKKTFQNEFDNNTDARLLAKSFRDLQNRFNHFETEQLDKRKSNDYQLEQKLREINEKINYFDHSLELKVEGKLRSSSVFEQVQLLEQEVNKLRNQALKDSTVGSRSNLESFASLEILIDDFKKTVLVELNQKASREDFKNLRAEIADQVDALRGKVQVALEHSEDSRSITHEIQELGHILVKVQKNEEDVKNHREEIESLSQDLNAFAVGLNDLKTKLKYGTTELSSESNGLDNLSVLSSLESLKKDFENFKNKNFENLEAKSDKQDFDKVVLKISSMFDSLKKDVEKSHEKSILVEQFAARFDQLEQKISIFDLKVEKGLGEVEEKTKLEIGDLKLDLQNVVEIQEQMGLIVADIEDLRKGYQNLLSEIDNGLTTEDYQTISDDIVVLEKDFKKLRSDFDIEFDKNTHLRQVYESVPEIKKALESLSAFTRHELSEKIAREEYVRKIHDQDQKIEFSIKELSESKKRYLEAQKQIERIQTEQNKSQKKNNQSLVGDDVAPKNYGLILAIGLLSGILGVVIGAVLMQTQMKPKWDAQFDSFRAQGEKQIEKMLSTPEIANLVNEKARVQTEAQINHTFKRAIQIYVDLIKNKTDTLISNIEVDSKEGLDRLDKTIELSRYIAESQAGQRPAFDKLLRISNNKDAIFTKTAEQAVTQIVSEINAKNSSRLPMNIKEFVVDEDYTSIENFKKIYQAMDAIYKPTMLLELWNITSLGLREKLNFLITEIRTTENLILLARAIELVDIEARLFEPLSKYEVYLHWWDDNQANYLPVEKTTHKSKFFF
jgi:hypothetical protein